MGLAVGEGFFFLGVLFLVVFFIGKVGVVPLEVIIL
jgi:hypothetical protein